MIVSSLHKPSRFRRVAAAARRVIAADAGPHRCLQCGRDFMCPIEWDTVGEEHWLIHSRCGECGAWRSEVVTNAEAKRYDLLLARQSEVIARGLRATHGMTRKDVAAYLEPRTKLATGTLMEWQSGGSG